MQLFSIAISRPGAPQDGPGGGSQIQKFARPLGALVVVMGLLVLVIGESKSCIHEFSRGTEMVLHFFPLHISLTHHPTTSSRLLWPLFSNARHNTDLLPSDRLFKVLPHPECSGSRQLPTRPWDRNLVVCFSGLAGINCLRCASHCSAMK